MKALLTIAVVLAALAVAAPGALGASRHQGATFITDTLAPGGGGSSPYDTQQHGATFITDTLAPGGGPVVQAAVASTGFSWPDAGVGVAAGFGGMLALIGVVLLTVRRRTGLAV